MKQPGEKILDDIIQEEVDFFIERENIITADSIKVLGHIKAVLKGHRQEPTLYTEQELIQAFVQGATWAVYPFDNAEDAETKAKFMLGRGELGKEEE